MQLHERRGVLRGAVVGVWGTENRPKFSSISLLSSTTLFTLQILKHYSYPSIEEKRSYLNRNELVKSGEKRTEADKESKAQHEKVKSLHLQCKPLK